MTVLDASAVVAWLRREPGAEQVDAAVEEEPVISAVNFAEVLSVEPELASVPLDDFEGARLSLAKKATAFFSTSRSRWAISNSCWSRLISACSGVRTCLP